jgi:oligopeptide/dipeptide ABC transporter ATP-binding protein
MGPPLLSVRNLRTHFHTTLGMVHAVDDVSFDVHRGEVVGLVGESGCGKSITARSILGIVPPPGSVVGGSILYARTPAEQPVDLAGFSPESSELRRYRGQEIAMIFQEPMSALSPVHTVGDQLVEALKLYHAGIGDAEARDRGIELLRHVGIPSPEKLIDAYVFELSGGMRQRALIAIAISGEPQLLIADEPTTAIDVTIQAKVLGLLQELQEQTGMAILFITHNLGVIAELADRVNVMYLGRIVESGSVYDLFDDPRHPYSQRLLQSIPSLAVPPGTELQTIEGSLPDPYLRLRGCRFAARCGEYMVDVCDGPEPELVAVGDGHRARCYLYDRPERASATEQENAGQRG